MRQPTRRPAGIFCHRDENNNGNLCNEPMATQDAQGGRPTPAMEARPEPKLSRNNRVDLARRSEQNFAAVTLDGLCPC
jgi:hypothetical protein